MAKPLLEFTDKGIYCAQGKFYIDPWKPVDDAVITHARADHAYFGHKNYLAHHLSKEVLYYRLGEINLRTIEYGETVTKNGVQISMYPAGHVIGSAQIRIEYKGVVWVVSGDYKTDDDGISTPFEPVKCHHFISECTFGMPVYSWKPQAEIFTDVNNWWRGNVENGIATVIVGYSLGKAQRILQNLDLDIGNVYTHGVIENTNEALRRNGVILNPTHRITAESSKEEVRKGIIIAPPSSVGTPWMRKFGPYSFGYCSGWMAIRGAKRRRAADRGFIMSDHADWNGLVSAIDATGCECVYLTHGYTASFTRYLNEVGFNAREVHTLYGGEEEEEASPQPSTEERKQADIQEGNQEVSPSGGDLEGAGYMKAFAQLFLSLDETNKTNEKVKVLKDYFTNVPDTDKMHMLALFTGRRPKRPINSTLIRTWAIEASHIPQWLFEESYHVVGDLAETMSLLMPESQSSSSKTLTEWIAEINAQAARTEEERKLWLTDSWAMLDRQERFVFNKLLTGSFRIGVSNNLVVKALADITGIEAPALTHRIMGSWMPEDYTYDQLVQEQNAADNISRPYPFFLAYPIQETSEKRKSAEEVGNALGDADQWQAEWKWDGIRAQMIKRGGEIFIWSRGEDLATEKFPELHPFLNALPDGTVLDGEILSFRDGLPLPFNVLQTRIGRKNLSKKILTDSPVATIVYDCLEYAGEDIRSKTQTERRGILEKLQSETEYPEVFRISSLIQFNNWEELEKIREQSRAMIAEGIMLKRKSATYQVGRRRGDWWKWKIDPLSVDAVMIYAQKGHGRRADLYTDYTFAVWDGDKLVPFAKAYSGLTDAEINKVDYFVKRNTLEKFGPVRTVKPELVFEIGFEGINKSTRHKSGIALRFPRILRWRHDKPKEEADTLDSLKDLLGEHGG